MTVSGINELKSQASFEIRLAHLSILNDCCQAMTLLSLWALAMSCLWLASDRQQVDAMFERYQLLPTIYGAVAIATHEGSDCLTMRCLGATSSAFAFATVLDVMAYLYAVTEEKVRGAKATQTPYQPLQLTLVVSAHSICRSGVRGPCCLPVLPRDCCPTSVHGA